MTTVREATYSLLRRNGITTVFGNPGSNELPFLSDFPPDFRYILGLHEGVVVGMADGYAQASGRTGFVNLHSAAGTGNGMGALANAWNSHTPLLITAGQQVRSTLGMEPLLANVDASNLPRPLVKWSHEPACAQEVPLAISRALHTAAAPAPGPTYVSVPYDDWAQELPAQWELLLERSVQHDSTMGKDTLAVLAQRLQAASHPVLVLGPDMDTTAARAAAITLAERLSAPVWIAPSAPRCPFPTTHACFRGVLPSGMASITRLLTGHDLIVVLGAPVFRYHQHEPGALLPPQAQLVSITLDIHEATRAPMGQAIVVGSLDAAVADLAQLLPQTARPMPARRAAPTAAQEVPGHVSPDLLFEVLNRCAPQDVIYVNESTSTMAALWSRLEMREQGSYFFPAAGGLGFGMPAAVGIQLAQPGRRVLALIGDGSANYGITSLWTAAHYDIPTIFIILKNGTYGALRWFAGVLGVRDAPGMDVPGIDFSSLARGYGVQAWQADSGPALEAALRQALASGKPALIEVLTAPAAD